MRKNGKLCTENRVKSARRSGQEGIQMDMFMDKLAQKLNAQEIIRANTAADTEELNRLKNQVAEYNECLKRLRSLIDEGTEKLRGAQTGGESVERLVAESLEKLQSVRQDNTGLEELGKKLEELGTKLEGRLAELESRMDRQPGELAGKLDELGGKISRQPEELGKKLSVLEGKIDRQPEELGKKLSVLEGKIAGQPEEFGKRLLELEKRLVQSGGSGRELRESLERLEQNVTERLDGTTAAVDESIHKECVKVYRNVQAVVMEESEKQAKSVGSAMEEVGATGKKLGTILGISVVALIISLTGVVIQVLNLLHIIDF
jgi:chromosome segregation ATPase